MVLGRFTSRHQGFKCEIHFYSLQQINFVIRRDIQRHRKIWERSAAQSIKWIAKIQHTLSRDQEPKQPVHKRSPTNQAYNQHFSRKPHLTFTGGSPTWSTRQASPTTCPTRCFRRCCYCCRRSICPHRNPTQSLPTFARLKGAPSPDRRRESASRVRKGSQSLTRATSCFQGYLPVDHDPTNAACTLESAPQRARRWEAASSRGGLWKASAGEVRAFFFSSLQ